MTRSVGCGKFSLRLTQIFLPFDCEQNRRMKWKKDEAKQRPRLESGSDTEESSTAAPGSPASEHSTAPSCNPGGDKDLNANEPKHTTAGGDISDSSDAKAKKTDAAAAMDAKSHSDDSRSSENDTAHRRSSTLSPWLFALQV